MAAVMNVVGARPQFVKAGPVSRALRNAGIEEFLVHTGQHYDDLMSDAIIRGVGLREPDLNLGVGSGTHGYQTAAMLEGVEQALLERRVDALLTYGDTNSTVASALAAAKLGVFTAHVEAGLRSFNRRMPEELNRVATDHLSDLLLAPTNTAMSHLADEGLADRAVLTGDVMVDALQTVDFKSVQVPGWASGEFILATIHRPENTDDPGQLSLILESLASVDLPAHLLAHPRLMAKLDETGWPTSKGSLTIQKPLPYEQMLASVHLSQGLVTDSGGLQKEAFILGTICVTVRTETEWPETLEGGWNMLAGPGADLNPMIRRHVQPVESAPFGDGDAARRIVDELARHL